MKLSEMFDNLDELRIDNKQGWGAVPDNQNVDYKGLRVRVKPSMFLKLAHELGTPFSAGDIEKHISADGAIGAPFLVIAIPQDWFEGDLTLPAEIYGHEGRNRMTAILRAEGDIPVETHLFFGGGVRNRDLKPDIIDRLNKSVISQRGVVVKGPWFNTAVSEDTKVRISKDPANLGADVWEEEPLEPIVLLKRSDITNVLEPDHFHAEKPGATERIAKMVKAIKAGKTLPPILVRRYKNGYQVLDGHHRFKAYRITNTDQIPARVVAPENITGDIDEAFNNPYDLPKRWKTDSDAAHWKQISLPNNSSLKVQIDWEPDEKIAVWNFWINDKQTITGGGDAFRIFATAIVALQQFVRSKKPNIIAFIGNDEDPSRVKLYDKLVPWLIQKGGLSSYTNLTDEKNWWPDSLWWFFDGLYDTSGKMYVLAKKAWFYKNAVDNEEYDDDMLENFADGKSRSVYESAFNMERYADQARSAIAVGWLDNVIQGMAYGVKVGKVVAGQPIKDLLDENKNAIVTYVLRLIRTNQARHKENYLEDVVSMLRKLEIDWPELAVIEKSIAADMNENFADGKGPGRKGDSQRHGIPKNATMAQLQKAAKSPGRKGQLARWQINMRRGRKKTNEAIAPHGDADNELKMMKAGTKPAVLLHGPVFDELYRPLIKQMEWELVRFNMDGHEHQVVAQKGERARAERIARLVSDAGKTWSAGKQVGPEYHRELGTLLGYSKTDVDHFISKLYKEEVANESGSLTVANDHVMLMDDLEDASLKNPMVYVDMDGVLADLFGHARDLHDVDTYRKINRDQWDRFFSEADAEHLFAALGPFPTANKLLRMVTRMFGGYKILSSPLNFDREGSIRGKQKWLDAHIRVPDDGRVFDHEKYKYAVQPDGTPNILIDDYGVNIKLWNDAGGIGIKYQADEDSLDELRNKLTAAIAKQS